jgi:hypothetical protein
MTAFKTTKNSNIFADTDPVAFFNYTEYTHFDSKINEKFDTLAYIYRAGGVIIAKRGPVAVYKA